MQGGGGGGGGGGGERNLSHQLYRELSSCMHECSHPHPRSTQRKKKKSPPLRRRTQMHEGLHCVYERKGGLERRCFTFDLVEGWFVQGRGGWRTAPGDQWKSWALTCRTCEKDLLVCERVLKAAVKVAVGVKYPTLHFTTHCHTFAKTQTLRQNKRAIHLLFTNLAQMEALKCYKFP